jgi:hypothetical protein
MANCVLHVELGIKSTIQRKKKKKIQQIQSRKLKFAYVQPNQNP